MLGIKPGMDLPPVPGTPPLAASPLQKASLAEGLLRLPGGCSPRSPRNAPSSPGGVCAGWKSEEDSPCP